MDNEKLDLILSSIQNMQTDINGLKTDVSDMKADIGGLKTDINGIKTDIDGLKNDIEAMKIDIEAMKIDIDSLKTDNETMKTDIKNLNTDMKEVKQRITKIDLTLESEIRVNIQRIAEGHLDLSRNLHDAMKPSNEIEMLVIKVRMLESDMRDIKMKLANI